MAFDFDKYRTGSNKSKNEDSDNKKSGSFNFDKYRTTTKSGAAHKQYADAMKSSRLMEIDNAKKQEGIDAAVAFSKKLSDSGKKDTLSLNMGPINQDAYNRVTKARQDEITKRADDAARAIRGDTAASKRLETKLSTPLSPEENELFNQMVEARRGELYREERDVSGLRQLPVIGSAYRAIDKLADTTKPFSDLAMEYYTPGAGLNVITGLTRGAEFGVSKALPGLARTALSQAPQGASFFQKSLPTLARVGQTALSEGIVGIPLQAANTLTRTGDLEKAAKEGLIYGGLGGALLGGAGRAIGEGVQGLRGLAQGAAEDVVSGQLRNALNTELPPTVSRGQSYTNVTPKFTSGEQVPQDWFTKMFGEQGVGITPFGSKKSSRMVTTEQQIVNKPLKNNVEGIIAGTKQAGRAFKQSMVDYLSPLKEISPDAYDAAMDASRANNIANTIIRDKFVDLQGNVIGNSLKEVFDNTRGLGKKVDDYLILRHAITRMERGESVYDTALNMTPEKARQQVKVMEQRYPQLVNVGEMWDQFNTNLLDSGVSEGLITQAARDSMREANPNYASMRRQFTLGEKMSSPKYGEGGSSFSGQKAPIKSVSPTGSTRKIVSPIRSAIEQAYAWKNAELRNRTMQEIVKSIQVSPEDMKGIAEIIKKPSTSYKSLDDALREGGSEEFLELLDNDFKNLFKKSQTGEENIVRAMVNGQPVYIKVNNPEAVKALLGMGGEQANIVMRAFQMLSNATKRGATGLLAPMFAVKNLTGDTVQAAIQSPNGIKHLFVDVPHAFVSSISDVMRIPGLKNLAEDFRRVGGEYSALLRGDRKLNTAVGSLRKEAFLSPKGIGKGIKATVKSPFKVLEKVADVTENLNRMAAYRRALKGKERTPENVRKAINAARESTVNFSRKGSASQGIESFVPYSNAATQGIYRVIKSFSSPKQAAKTLAGIGTLVIAPKLYEFAKFHNDEDYNRLPAREKYRNIFISKNADGTFNKQPLPPEYAAFGQIMNDILSDVVDDNPTAYKGSLDALVNAFTPPIVSGAAQGVSQGGGVEQSVKGALNATVLAPAVAIAGNQSFTGAPIVPERLQGNSPELQADERTSSIAKYIGDKVGLAPLKVDYLLRAYGGDPSRLLLPLLSDVGGGTVRNTLLKNFIADPVFTNTLSNDFFDAKSAYETAKNDFTDFGKPLPQWFTDEGYKLITSRAKGSPSKQLSEFSEEKRAIQGDRSLSAKVKADKIREVQSKINDIYADVNSKILGMGYKFPNR